MATIQSGLTQLNAHDEYGDAIQSTITDIFAFADYHSGWIDGDFRYETPMIVFVLESPLGRIHAQTKLSEIADGNCYELLNSVQTGETELESLDIRELIGETVYMTPDSDFHFATLWTEPTNTNQYDNSRSVCLRELDRSPVGRMKSDDLFGDIEPRSLDWLNKQVRIEFERFVQPYDGWIEREISAVTSIEGQIEVQVPITADWEAKWVFDDSFTGKKRLKAFAQGLGLPADVDELKGALVYVHPVRNLPHTLPREKFSFDSLERFILAGNPENPEPAKKSVLTRFLELFYSSGGIEVSVGDGPRVAKSSDTFDVEDDSRMNSKESEAVEDPE